jgi:hypothetical protein
MASPEVCATLNCRSAQFGLRDVFVCLTQVVCVVCRILHCCAGIEAVWELAQEVDKLCGPGRIRMLDIGGGLSVNYSTDHAPQVTTVCFGPQCRAGSKSCRLSTAWLLGAPSWHNAQPLGGSLTTATEQLVTILPSCKVWSQTAFSVKVWLPFCCACCRRQCFRLKRRSWRQPCLGSLRQVAASGWQQKTGAAY